MATPDNDVVLRWLQAVRETAELMHANDRLLRQREQLRRTNVEILRDFVRTADDFCQIVANGH